MQIENTLSEGKTFASQILGVMSYATWLSFCDPDDQSLQPRRENFGFARVSPDCEWKWLKFCSCRVVSFSPLVLKGVALDSRGMHKSSRVSFVSYPSYFSRNELNREFLKSGSNNSQFISFFDLFLLPHLFFIIITVLVSERVSSSVIQTVSQSAVSQSGHSEQILIFPSCWNLSVLVRISCVSSLVITSSIHPFESQPFLHFFSSTTFFSLSQIVG